MSSYNNSYKKQNRITSNTTQQLIDIARDHSPPGEREEFVKLLMISPRKNVAKVYEYDVGDYNPISYETYETSVRENTLMEQCAFREMFVLQKRHANAPLHRILLQYFQLDEEIIWKSTRSIVFWRLFKRLYYNFFHKKLDKVTYNSIAHFAKSYNHHPSVYEELLWSLESQTSDLFPGEKLPRNHQSNYI
jgi:uncharacterized protein (UPF0248 family)